MQLACLRDISYRLQKHVWTDWQFQVLVQWSDTQFSSTSWIKLIEFLILWRRPFSESYKHIFHNARNLTKPKTYFNPVRHFLTFRYISWQDITSRNQHVFKRRHPLSPWLYKWKCFWWRTWKHQPSKFFPSLWSLAFSNKRAWFGQSGKNDSMEKEIRW